MASGVRRSRGRYARPHRRPAQRCRGCVPVPGTASPWWPDRVRRRHRRPAPDRCRGRGTSSSRTSAQMTRTVTPLAAALMRDGGRGERVDVIGGHRRRPGPGRRDRHQPRAGGNVDHARPGPSRGGRAGSGPAPGRQPRRTPRTAGRRPARPAASSVRCHKLIGSPAWYSRIWGISGTGRSRVPTRMICSAGGVGWALPIMMVLRAGRADAEHLTDVPQHDRSDCSGASWLPGPTGMAGGPAAVWWLRSCQWPMTRGQIS